jgi:ubiquinone/menaquinone biosynthesis C-methylase UbiE
LELEQPVTNKNNNEDSESRWSERAKAWSSTTEKGISKDDTFNQMIIKEVGIKSGEKVLDLASGSGNPAISIASFMKKRGQVFCTDITPSMLIVARQRAQHLNLKILKFIVSDMQSQPFESEFFDAITCRFGIMFAKNKFNVVKEAGRVLKKGGRVALIVWGAYEENPPFYVPRRAVAKHLGIREGPKPNRHSMAKPGTLEKIMKESGFIRVEERELRYNNDVVDIEEYVIRNLKRSFSKETDCMTDTEFSLLKDTVISAWQPFYKNNVFSIPNYARLALGSKAG